MKVEKYSTETNRALIRTLSKDEFPKAQDIDPVDGAWIEADLLFPLIRGRDLGRYSIQTEQWHQIIPNAHYENVASEEDFAEAYPCAYSYFTNYRDLLVKRSTYKRYQEHLPFYVIYCVGDYSFGKWKVAWMEQQDPSSFRCSVVSDVPSSITPNRTVVPDHKLYFVDADTREEAHYLAAFLNSRPVRTWLGGFLHGKQIATTVFEFMHVPKFDKNNAAHRRLAVISMTEHRHRAGTLDTKFLAPECEEELTTLVRSIAPNQP